MCDPSDIVQGYTIPFTSYPKPSNHNSVEGGNKVVGSKNSGNVEKGGHLFDKEIRINL